MRAMTLPAASKLRLVVGIIAAQSTRKQNAHRPHSAADVEHGLQSAVPNARMAALVRQCGVDFELTVGVEKALRSAGANDNLILQIGRSQGVV